MNRLILFFFLVCCSIGCGNTQQTSEADAKQVNQKEPIVSEKAKP